METAHLSIVDGAWQEAPDNLAIVDDAGRGTLYLLVQVAGETEGRDSITRELIETVRREYGASRGSVTLALTEALRAANNLLYDANASTPLEARRYAGLTAGVLRERELFVVQGGPGVTWIARGSAIGRYPDESPWFDAHFDPGEARGEYPTGGAVPLGIRRDYTPDAFHVVLEPGDSVLLSTCSLTHLLTDEEVLNTLVHRHPEEIVENLEDLAGSQDLSVISVVCEPIEVPSTQSVPESVSDVSTVGPMETEAVEPGPPTAPSNAAAGPHPGRALFTRLVGIPTALARKWGEPDLSGIGAAGNRLGSGVLSGLLFLALASSRTFLSDELAEQVRGARSLDNRRQKLWHLAALVVPFLLLLMGGAAWISYRSDVTRAHAAQIDQLTVQANAALEAGKNSARGGDKPAARTAFEKAKSLAQQMQVLNPNHPAARKITFDAQDQLDGLNGIAVLSSIAKFGTLGSPANRARIILRWPDIFVLDREAQRIYRYTANEAGTNVAPISTDGVILKAGDNVGARGVVDLLDILWIDAGRLVALDRSGTFLQYDPAKSAWSMRPASDGSQWARVTLATTFAGNLYLLDPSKSQIFKYTANDVSWSPGVAYLATGVNVDLSSVADMAIDGDVWVLRADGSLWRLSSGRLADFSLRDLEMPLAKPSGLVTSQAMVGLYIVDAGNQRVVQFDKANGRFVRQFRPGSENRDTFAALKTVAVDEANRKVVFVSGGQVYLATTPQ